MTHEQILGLADYALYQAKGSGRNRAVGLLPEGETVSGGTVEPAIHIDGISASPVITTGPLIEGTLEPSNATTRSMIATVAK